ncbi:hypothetical protein [Allohahella marinimesophila]|uniref:hypothetical protein n=1 Tax=Allohahella marinimesophila TaxID=1054972 RepID=UPI0031E396CB
MPDAEASADTIDVTETVAITSMLQAIIDTNVLMASCLSAGINGFSAVPVIQMNGQVLPVTEVHRFLRSTS